MEDIEQEEGRGLIGTTVHNYAGQYLSPVGALMYGTYRGLSSYNIRMPGLFPTFGIYTPQKGWFKKLIFGSNVSFKPEFSRDIAFRDWIMKDKAKFAYQALKEHIAKGAPITRSMKMEAKNRIINQLEKRFERSYLTRSARWLARSGTALNVMTLGVGAALVGAWVANKAMSMGVNAGGEINAINRTITSLELGGNLSSGFISSEAATERQRALQSIQASHLSGRRWLGSEASFYH